MTSTAEIISDREIRFHRRLRRNLVFGELISFFVGIAKEQGIRKSDIAMRLGKDASQISRWLAEPANLELDTISDLLLAMKADLEFRVVPAKASVSTEAFMADFRNWAQSQSHFTTSNRVDLKQSGGGRNSTATENTVTADWLGDFRESAVG